MTVLSSILRRLNRILTTRIVAVLLLAALPIMPTSSVRCDSPDRVRDTELELVDLQRFDQPLQNARKGQTILTAEGWYLSKEFQPESKGEGSCTVSLFDNADHRLWIGEVGCTIYPAPRKGVFFAYNPSFGNRTDIYNISISDKPVASPSLYPTEHVYSFDGSLILFGGGILALYDTEGRKYFEHKQRHESDMALGISPNGEYVIVADLLAGSTLDVYEVQQSSPQAKKRDDNATQQDKSRTTGEKTDGQLDAVAPGSKEKRPPQSWTERVGRTGNPNFATVLTTDGEVVSEINIPDFARAIAVSDNGRTVAVACGPVITVLDEKGGRVWEYRFDKFDTFVKNISFDGFGNVAAVINEGWQTGSPDTRFLYTWNQYGELSGWAPLEDRRALDYYDLYTKREGDTVIFRDDRLRAVYRVDGN